MNGQDTALFSKASDEWATPGWLFDMLDDEFQFHLDAAATMENSKCGPCYCDKIGNALELEMDWDYHSQGFPIWLNPPYSKIAAFMKKAYEESLKGAVVVCLIPVRSDTRYWHDYVMKAQEIRFVKRRLSFYGKIKVPGQPKDTPKDQIKYMMGWAPAPFPSVIVIFKNKSVGEFLENPYYPEIGNTIEQPRSKP
jgi:site-specific DNA-methyltransferase (adenine-specific)